MAEKKENKSPLIITGVVSAALSLGLALDKNVHPGIKFAIPMIGFVSCSIARNGVRHQLTDIEEQFQSRWEGIDLRERELLDKENEYDIALKRLEQEKRRLHNDHVTRINSLKEAEERHKNQYLSKEQEMQAEFDAALADLNKERQIFERERELQESLLAAKKDQIASQLHEQSEQRRAELDSKEAALNLRIKSINEQLASAKNNLEAEYLQRLNAFEVERQEIFDKHQRELDNWKQKYKDAQVQIAISKAPKFPLGGDEIAVSQCIKIIRHLWSLETPIKVDCHERNPQDQGNCDVFWLILRDATQLKALKEQAEVVQLLLGKAHKPVITQERGEATIRFELKRNTEPNIVLKASKQGYEERIPSLAKHKDGSRGWLLTGHPGAGKTSVLIWLGQLIGGEECDRIALNPHTDDKSSFEDYGYYEINDLGQCYEQIDLLKEELNLRGSDPARRKKLVIAVDELGKFLSNASDFGRKPEQVMETFRQINVEGRKLNMVVLIGNHSQTTTAIKMDAEFRSAFYQVFLVGAARELLKKPNSPELKDEEKKWIADTAYPALTLINGQYSLALHPTHWEYEEYRDKGNPPKGLKRMPQKPLDIKVVGKDNIAINYGLSSEERDSINNMKDFTISQIIYQIWGLRPSKNSEYQARKQQVESYLGSLTQNC